MAMLIDSNYSNSSSNYYRKTSSESAKRSNTQASAYSVNASTMALTGLHFSTCRAGGQSYGSPLVQIHANDRRGGFEDPVGQPPPPASPDSARLRRPVAARKRSGDAAYHITEECERLFCETLKAVFLVERDTGLENSLVVDTRNKLYSSSAVPIPKQQQQQQQPTILKHDLPTPSPSPDGRIYPQAGGLVREYVEVWDYAGDARFRGFVAEKDDERSLFVFFDHEVMGMDLKPGLMALLELASSEGFECDQLVVCVDRSPGQESVEDVTRDLGWVGFELVMLDGWARTSGALSDRWLFLGMDV